MQLGPLNALLNFVVTFIPYLLKKVMRVLDVNRSVDQTNFKNYKASTTVMKIGSLFIAITANISTNSTCLLRGQRRSDNAPLIYIYMYILGSMTGYR